MIMISLIMIKELMKIFIMQTNIKAINNKLEIGSFSLSISQNNIMQLLILSIYKLITNQYLIININNNTINIFILITITTKNETILIIHLIIFNLFLLIFI